MSDFTPSANIVRICAGQAHYVSHIDETGLGAVDAAVDDSAPLSLWGETWKNLRRRPISWIALTIIVTAPAISAFPSLFMSQDPRFCRLSNSFKSPSNGHPFGFNHQGYDIYSRIIYNARTSISVGVFTTILVVLFGGVIGAATGCLGGRFDALLPCITDISFVIPLPLAAIAFMQMFEDNRNIWVVIIVFFLFSWAQIARITRGAAMPAKNEEFVTMARATGTSKNRILLSHIIPNSMAPIIIYATAALGTFIVSKASSSFMNIGLSPKAVSWDVDIFVTQVSLRTNPTVLFYPALTLALTVLSPTMMSDIARDTLDPKVRR